MELIKKLCLINGVSGDEERVASFILKQVKPFAKTAHIDKIGNVIAFKEGWNKEKTMVVCAHMDEVGLIVKHITKDGFIKFDKVGGIDERVILGKRVVIGEENVPGVIGVKAIHLTEKEERTRAIKGSEMYIDIGAKSDDDALKKVNLGDYISFKGDIMEYGNGFLKAKGIDDRAGCAILIDILKKEPQNNTYFIFSVCEEIGLRGATVAMNDIKADEAIVLETTTCADFEGVEEKDWVSRAKGGAVISVMDRSTIYDKDMVARAIETAKAKGIKYQIKKSVAGGNEAGIIHRSGGGVKTLAISIPLRYLHSPSSAMAVEDFFSVRDLASALICKEEK